MTPVSNVELCFGDCEYRMRRKLLGSCVAEPFFDGKQAAAVHRLVDSLENKSGKLILKIVFADELKRRIPLTAPPV
jgi:hypothetical protein